MLGTGTLRPCRVICVTLFAVISAIGFANVCVSHSAASPPAPDLNGNQGELNFGASRPVVLDPAVDASSGTASCVIPATGVIGWWAGDGSAADLNGGHHGSLYNGATYASGLVGQAFSFNGVDGHVRIPHSSHLNSTGALTLEAWIFPASFPGFSSTFLGKWDSIDGVDQRSYALNIDAGGTITFYINTDGTHDRFQTIRSGNAVPLNAWSHVAGVYDGSTMKVYVNGELGGQIPYSQGVFAGTADVSIGAIASGGPVGQSAGNFSGKVDEATVYNRPISAVEVKAIFNAGSAGKCKESTCAPVVETTCESVLGTVPYNHGNMAPISAVIRNDGTLKLSTIYSGLSEHLLVYAKNFRSFDCQQHGVLLEPIAVSKGDEVGIEERAGDHFVRVTNFTSGVSGDWQDPYLADWPHGMQLNISNFGYGPAPYDDAASYFYEFPRPACLPPTEPQQRPLIFIPGIAGSRLDSADHTKIWPPASAVGFANPSSSTGYTRLSLDPNPLFITSDIVVPDVIRFYEEAPRPEDKDVYGSILTALADPAVGGYRNYAVDDQPGRRTYDGCDLSQQPNNPTLFVFAYDWRKSNIEAAAALKEYVRCIQRFYPSAEVDIVAHSQGGLVARRYILDHPADHHVNKLVTIASPWLGAPKAINVLETGRFLDPSSVVKNLVKNHIFKTLSAYYPSVHELVPSQTYFDAGGVSPYEYNGLALNYSQMAGLLDRQFPASKPGVANGTFHGSAGQDDWSQDQSGVEYHHLYGVEKIANTVGRVVQRNEVVLAPSGASVRTVFDIIPTNGDGTVPIMSARRSLALNAPGVWLTTGRVKGFTWVSTCDGQSGPVDHVGLMRNPCVIAEILSRLRAAQSPQTSGAMFVTAEPGEPEAQPAHYLRVIGAASAAVQDGLGNTSDPLGDPADNNVPGVTSYLLGDQSFLTIIPLGQPYTVTLRAGAGPVRVELTQGNDAITSQATRYHDLVLPAGALARIQITPQGADMLQYDGNGDGTFETNVTPTAVVTGTAAQDHDPPAVACSKTPERIGTSVSLTATDGGSGVKTIYYSTDGANFQAYSEPVIFASPGNHVVFAFAEDNAANRSGLSICKATVPRRMPRMLGRRLARATASRKRF